MNWMGLLLILIVVFVSGMVTMGIVASKGYYEATTEAYKTGYEKGKQDEYERIGKLLDKYTEDLERGAVENKKE